MQDLSKDVQVKSLIEQIQNEKDSKRLTELTNELNHLLDSRLESGSSRRLYPTQGGN
jgi:hypothetical protein